MLIEPQDCIYRTTVQLNVTALGDEAVSVDNQSAFVLATVAISEALNVVSDVLGWIYFVAWSVSFYPQIYQNWRRKSVVGLNFDFVALNIVGFVLYSLFNVSLYWIPVIQDDYFELHPTGVIPVQV